MISNMLYWYFLSEEKVIKFPDDALWKQAQSELFGQILSSVDFHDKRLKNSRCEFDTRPLGTAICFMTAFILFFIPGFVCVLFGFNAPTDYIGPVYFKTVGSLIDSYYITSQSSSDDNGNAVSTTLILVYAYGGQWLQNRGLYDEYQNGTSCVAIQASSGVSYTIGGSHDLLVYHSEKTNCNFPRRVAANFVAGMVLLTFSSVLLIGFICFWREYQDMRKINNAPLPFIWPEQIRDDAQDGDVVHCCRYCCCCV